MTNAKPKCEAGTPCGDACISKQDSCTSYIAKSVAKGAISAAKSAAKDASANKAATFGNAAATALSFAFPADLAADGDVVISAVSDALTYMAQKVILQVQKTKRRQAYA